MTRRVNLYWLGGALGGALVLGLGIVLLHEWQMVRHAGEMVRYADRASAAGQFYPALLYYQNYLIYQPRDTAALIRYGLTLDKMSSSSAGRYRAYLVLEQALRRDADNTALRQELLRIALQLDRYEDAISQLRSLLQDQPRDDQLWRQLGQCQTVLEEYEAAAASYRQAIVLAPTVLTHYIDLSNLLENRLERPAEVLQVLDDMVKANPKDYRAYLARANYLHAHGPSTAGWQSLCQARELAPDNLEVLLAVAAAQQQKDELTQAAATLEHGLQKHPRAAILYEKLAALARQRRQPQEALRWLRQGLEQIPADAALQLTLADVLIQQNDTEQAPAALQQLRQHADLAPVADLLQARLLAQQDDWPQALKLLERLRARPEALSLPGRAQLFQLLGNGCAHQGDYPQAWRFHQKAAQTEPDWVLPRFALGEDFLALGRPAEAVEQFRPLLETAAAPPTTPILYVQAVLLAQRSQPSSAPDWNRLTELLDKAQKKNPDAVQIPLLRAEILTENGQAASARKLLEQLHQQQPREVAFVVALADLARREQQLDQARQYLDEAEQKWPGSLAVQRGWLRYWSGHGGKAALTALRGMLDRSAALPPAQRWPLLRELAAALTVQGDLDAARQCWLEVANHYPRDLHSRVQLLELALQQRDPPAVQRWLAELHQLEGADGLWWRYGEAARIVRLTGSAEPADLQRAQKYLDEIKKAQPNWGGVWLLSGLLEERLGQEKQAIQSYLAALSQGELPPALMVRLAQVLFDRRRFLEAELVVRHLEEKGPLPRDMARLAAELALVHKDLPRAAQLARAAVPAETHDYRAQLWLVRVLNQSGAAAEAETLLRRLSAKAAHVPEVWVRLAEQLLHNGKKDAAQALLEDIPRQVPPPQQTATLARCLEALGEQTRAEQLLLQQGRQDPGNFRTWKALAEFYLRQQRYAQAEPWLRKLSAPANQLPPPLVQRAQRQLAVALAKQGSAHAAEALALLQAALGQRSPARDDRAALAFVLAAQPEHYSQAIQMLEQLRLEPAHAPEEELTLADLYLKVGEPEKAGKLLLWLINLDREQPDYLAAYVACLLALQDVDGAEYYLQRLQQLQPDLPRTRQLQQRVRAARNSLAPAPAIP